MDRRQCLGLLGSGIGVLTGCISANPSPMTTQRDDLSNRSSTPIQTNSSTAEPSCTPDKKRLKRSYQKVEYGELNGFILRTCDESVQIGEELTVSLTNKADEEKLTGNKWGYDIQRCEDEQWKSIFWIDEDNPPAINSIGIIHEPGQGFTWELTMTQDGLAHRVEGGTGSRAVCSPISPGTYRFIYPHCGSNGGAVLGVRFTVTEGRSKKLVG